MSHRHSPDRIDAARFAGFLALAAVAGCGSPDDGASQAQPPAEHEAVLTFRLGAADQDAPHFTYIASAAVGPAGELLVVDRFQPGVFLFDARGDLLRSIGRRGQGPGEFEAPTEAGFFGDSLWVWDQGLYRLTWFDSHGGTLGTRPFPRDEIPGTPWRTGGVRPLRGGAFFLRVGILSQIAADTVLPLPVLVLDRQGERRLIAALPAAYPTQAAIPRRGSVWPIYSPQYIKAQPIVGMERGGSWFFTLRQPMRLTDEPIVAITRYGVSRREIGDFAIGDIGDFAISVTPRPMIPGARDSLADVLLAAVPSDLRPELDRSEVARAWAVPDIFPPVQQAFADSTGIWLRREGFVGRSDPVRWERYDLRGDLVSSVDLPGDLRGLATTPTAIVGVRIDDLDVPLLYRYDVRQ